MIPTYSIVIPVYNAENYLDGCMQSVLMQRSGSKYEIILVNDGSADHSAELCDRYAAQLPCVKVIHQTNQGVSAARNAGISASSGMYILFLDADDCWDEGLLDALDQLIPQQPDIIEFGYQKFGGTEDHAPVFPAVKVSGVTGAEYFGAHKARNCMPIASSCTAAFRRQLLENHNIRFPVGISYGEDFDFHMQCLKAATSVVSLREAFYRYRMNEQSATHTLTLKKMRDMLLACIKMYRIFPCELFADYYCMKILSMEKLSKQDAAQLKDLLRENSDILRQVSGRKMRFARMLYRVLGYYGASRLIRKLLDMQHPQKGKGTG